MKKTGNRVFSFRVEKAPWMGFFNTLLSVRMSYLQSFLLPCRNDEQNSALGAWAVEINGARRSQFETEYSVI
jgi:hypothetical protein